MSGYDEVIKWFGTVQTEMWGKNQELKRFWRVVQGFIRKTSEGFIECIETNLKCWMETFKFLMKILKSFIKFINLLHYAQI